MLVIKYFGPNNSWVLRYHGVNIYLGNFENVWFHKVYYENFPEELPF